MIERSGFSSLLFAGLCVLMIAMGTAAVAADVPKALLSLGRPPAEDAAVELRITSLKKAGGRSVSSLKIEHFSGKDGRRLLVAPRGKNSGYEKHCVLCGKSGIPRACGPNAGVFPASPDDPIYDTLLPWHVLTDWFCLSYKIVKSPRYSFEQYDAYEFVHSRPGGMPDAGRRLIFVSRKTGHPERIDQINAREELASSIKILEIRSTVWGKVITKSIYSNPQKQTRVLMEVLSGAVALPDDAERK